ncbi:MAG: T9SS type A sorting domain-containing protein [Bacteroidetes bacterium]|nr:T9SS type A sorting domain-containing protein [Bacteroidota bacterium]
MMKKCYPLIAIFVLLITTAFAQFKNSDKGAPGKEYYTNSAFAVFSGEKVNTTPNTSYQIAATSPVTQLKHADVQQARKQWGANVPSTGTEYDVKYYRLELRINPDTSKGNYVKGKVTTYFTTAQANFTQIKFDMATALTADSVYYHGVKVTAGNISRTTDLITITVPNIATSGTLDSVSIWYQGVPPAVAGLAGTGYVTAKHNTTQNYVYTLSEPYSAYTWWPCKSFIVNDKADSMDMYTSTPLNFRSASNGTRVYEVTQGSDVLTYWKERYPVSSYQVCVAVANYQQYPTTPDTVVLSGTKMPVYNLIFPETNTTNAHTSLDRVPLMITTYSSLYGDYAFKNEKYGNYTFGFGGGMEHNTFSGESNSGVYTAAGNWDVLAHELAHQWFGANVTCGSWHDIWLNESFADFSEALCLEFAPSIATSVGTTAQSWRATKKSNSISATYQSQSTYVTDTSTILTIFTPSVYIYDRGGMILNMLRALLGDTKFFQGLKDYQSDPLLKLGNGFTADIKRNLENASGLDLTNFFYEWLYNTGYAKYSGITGSVCQWNNSGNNIAIKLVQKLQSVTAKVTTPLTPVTHLDMPVVVRIQGSVPATQDTTVIIYDNAGTLYYDNNGVLTSTGTNIINYHLSFTPVTITMDAFSQTLATGTFTKNTGIPVTVLATNILSFNGYKDGTYGKLNWVIDQSLDYSSFSIERSADGNNFSSIGTMNAVDYPNATSFNFTDYNMLSSINYYRVKIIDKNGEVIYTKTITINNRKDNNFTVSPNPAKDFIQVYANGIKDAADIKIIDAGGKVVKQLNKQSFANNNTVRIPVADMNTGMYFVQIQLPDADMIIKQISVIR